MAEAATPSGQGAGWSLLTTRNIIAGVIVIVALLFVFQNTETGDFNFLFFEFSAPKWLWMLGVFGAGFASGILFTRHRAGTRS
jgi:uncharacterized integral membrane protein